MSASRRDGKVPTTIPGDRRRSVADIAMGATCRCPGEPDRRGSYLPDCGSVASPICEFILAGIDRHNRGEEDIPLGVCKNCRKFMAIERQGRKKFCSKNCGVKSFYAAKGAKYMRELRQSLPYKKKQR